MGNDFTALDAALQNLQAATADMQTAVTAFETPPEPPPGTEMVVNTDKLNVRPTPDTSQPPVATLLRGDVVRVIPATPEPWRQIVYGMYTGRYVSGAYLANPT